MQKRECVPRIVSPVTRGCSRKVAPTAHVASHLELRAHPARRGPFLSSPSAWCVTRLSHVSRKSSFLLTRTLSLASHTLCSEHRVTVQSRVRVATGYGTTHTTAHNPTTQRAVLFSFNMAHIDTRKRGPNCNFVCCFSPHKLINNSMPRHALTRDTRDTGDSEPFFFSPFTINSHLSLPPCPLTGERRHEPDRLTTDPSHESVTNVYSCTKRARALFAIALVPRQASGPPTFSTTSQRAFQKMYTSFSLPPKSLRRRSTPLTSTRISKKIRKARHLRPRPKYFCSILLCSRTAPIFCHPSSTPSRDHTHTLICLRGWWEGRTSGALFSSQNTPLNTLV